jgi:hypothetical protein
VRRLRFDIVKKETRRLVREQKGHATDRIRSIKKKLETDWNDEDYRQEMLVDLKKSVGFKAVRRKP